MAKERPVQVGTLQLGTAQSSRGILLAQVVTIQVGVTKSLFGKVYTPPTSRLSIRRIVATSMRVSLVCTIRS
jgi:hypothetical protein